MPNNFQVLQDMVQRKRKSSNNLMQFTPFGYMWVSLNSKKLVASHTVYSMLEKEPFSEFFTVETWKSFVHPKDLYKLLQAEEELLHTGSPTLAEYRLTTQSGRQIFVSHYMYLSGLPHMEQKIMSLVQDVTEEKSAEIILEAMNESFFELDENFAFRRINEHAIKFWSLERLDMTGKQLTAIFPQIEGTRFNNILMRSQAEKTSIAEDVRDPVTGHWLHLSVSPYADGLIVIFYDIENEKESEQRLQESKNHYHSLVENIPDVVTRWDKDLKLMYANSAFEKKTGVSIETSFGKTNREMGQPDEIAIPYMNSLQKAFETGQPVEHFYSFPTPAGEVHFYSRLVPERNARGEVETVLGVASDITELKKAEQEARQSEKKITELNRSLSATNKELHLLNSELKNFATIASGNYSETLRHLYISMEMIVTNDARNLSNSGRANLRRAQGGVQKMKLLTDDINRYLRLYDTEIKKEVIEAGIIIQEVLPKFEKKINEANAQVELKKLPALSADRVLFSALMSNLVDNSIKFREPSRPLMIKINSPGTDEQEGTPYNIISLTDNGMGFSQEVSEKIFELFSKVHEIDQYKGSGIGLAICKKIMEMHGGFITVESIPGEGASFHCYFPAGE